MSEPNTPVSTDGRRSIDRWLGNYSEDHRHPTNIIIHWICVPVILWCAIAALWTIPVPSILGRPGFWAGVAMFMALMFYARLSRTLMFGMLAVFVLLGLGTEWLYRLVGPALLFWFAVILFSIAWVMQFIGHYIEGKRPSFITDLAYLLIGPAWLVVKLMQRVGLW